MARAATLAGMVLVGLLLLPSLTQGQVPPLPVPVPPLPPLPVPLPTIPDVGVVPTTTEVNATNPAAPVVPGRAQVTLFGVNYTFFEAPVNARPYTLINLSVAGAPAWANATVVPPFAFIIPQNPPCGCMRTAQGAAYLVLSTKLDAPAFEAATVTITAVAEKNGLYASSEATGNVTFQAGYRSKLDLKLEPPTVSANGPGLYNVSMRLTNNGNGATLVQFETGAVTQGINVTAPAPVTLPMAGTQSVVWLVELGADFKEGDATLRVRSFFADNTSVVGEDLRRVLPVFDERLEQAKLEAAKKSSTPFLDAPLLAAAAVGVALAARRRRA